MSSTDTEPCWNTDTDDVDSGGEGPIVVEDALEDQFRSEFSEDEYSEGVAAKEQDVELGMENDDVYKEVHMIVQRTREGLSKKKNILHPMRYGIVDLTGRHAPSQLVLHPWGEITLNASAERRNKTCDPEVRARIGQRCDYLLTYKGHAMCPEVLIGEVSGGIPAGANWKTCFQLSGFRLTIYAVGFFHGMWRVMMLDECLLPISNEDKESRIKVYSILKGLMEAARAEANVIRRMLNSDAYSLEADDRRLFRKREKDDISNFSGTTWTWPFSQI
ncbi:hypothetical protein INT43_005818 [Umbelopsis isabellina]|uniref:Uncharacterized protein n=1 Tax=Mortierella isabellina TaxID=91625 RepID=A0A8H7PJ93_MORIS|nr:hypothetical protein INT43_005818 [Umbelopsis isabellina]